MSFCMLTDRYPDTIHKKIQTANPNRNAFSVKLNLVHNPKYCMMCMVWAATSKWAFPGKCHCDSMACSTSLPIVFASPPWLSRALLSLLSTNWQFCQHHTMRPSTKKVLEQWSQNLNIIHQFRSHNVRPSKVLLEWFLQPLKFFKIDKQHTGVVSGW